VLAVTGNASGGLLSVDLVFQQANGADRLNSQMYSIERLGAKSDEGVSRIVRLSSLNMGGPSNQGFSHQYSVRSEAQPGLAAAALSSDAMNLVPWFLGSQRSAGTTASISLVTVNTDGVTTTFEAEGYRWDPRSVLIDGGPQRPPTGLYRR